MNFQKRPVPTRRNIQNHGDPYLDGLRPGEMALCKDCGAVYRDRRWEVPNQKAAQIKGHTSVETVCPACQKMRDRMPGGILTLSGGFLREHFEEIVNLLRREGEKAMQINPLGRIMDLQSTDDGIVVETTNEKLAQRLGRALNKAYAGEIEYKWSEDNKLARVNWHRE